MRSKFFDKEDHYHLGRPDHCPSIRTFLADRFDASNTALEIGAGNGRGTKFLADYFAKVIAIEPVAELVSKGQNVFDLDNVELYKVPIKEAGRIEFDYLICFQATHWFYESEHYQNFYFQAQQPVLDISSHISYLDRPEFFQALHDKHRIKDSFRGFRYPRELVHEKVHKARFSAQKVAHGICSHSFIDHRGFAMILSEIQQVFGREDILVSIKTKVKKVQVATHLS